MLKELSGFLKSRRPDIPVPPFWYSLAEMSSDKPSYELLHTLVEGICAQPGNKRLPDRLELNLLQIFLQHFTSYRGVPGTLLKTICLLPMFASCGFNSLMLLPHFLRSEKFRKGTRGSPYSVKDYYTVDPILNELSDFPTSTLFEAFIEAAHKLGISVFLDMVPRTAARDSLWILENPDWFYWIRPEHAARLVSLLQAPLPGLPTPASPNRKDGMEMIRRLPVDEIAAFFHKSPKHSAPDRWENFVSQNRKNPDFLDELVKTFGLITPPCTSDCANDSQPAWSDVTPLRLYEDYDPAFYEICGRTFLEKNAPFFIQPVLKASVFMGSSPFVPLWDKIAGVCRHYAEKYHLDGVRGDMFHALPAELVARIKASVPEDFVLIMENLFNDEGEALSVRHGFHFYTGNLFMVAEEGRDSMDFMLRQITGYKTRIVAMPVLGDSPPLFSRPRNKALLQIAISAFIPNSAFGLTADTLLENDLPLNLGLGFTEQDQERFLADMEKKQRSLAYFNNDYLNDCWDSMSEQKLEFTRRINALRQDLLGGKDWRLASSTVSGSSLLDFTLKCRKKRLRVIANFSDTESVQVTVDEKKAVPVLSCTGKEGEMTLGPYGMVLEP
ncbi:MAG: hypothetical protein PHQ23_08465 [Candidatus Wallbacteria bacterium]|nr:hypothetical protein [Candidatus Wallbacteria bacterium]